MSKIKTIVIAGFILIAIGVIGSILTYQIMDINPETKTETISGEKIMNVEIKSKNVDIKIIPVKNTSEITVELTVPKTKSRYNKLDILAEDDTLMIQTVYKSSLRFFNIGLFDSPRVLTIYLPEKMYQSLFLNADNGDLEMSELAFNEIQLDSDNGNIEMENITSETISINANNGDVELVHVDGAITLISNNGNVTMKTKTLDRSFDWDVINGDVLIVTETEPTNAVLDLHTRNGRISVFDRDDWKGIVGDGEHLLKIRLDNGNIEIRQ